MEDILEIKDKQFLNLVKAIYIYFQCNGYGSYGEVPKVIEDAINKYRITCDNFIERLKELDKLPNVETQQILKEVIKILK